MVRTHPVVTHPILTSKFWPLCPGGQFFEVVKLSQNSNYLIQIDPKDYENSFK